LKSLETGISVLPVLPIKSDGFSSQTLVFTHENDGLPSGKRLHNYGKSQFFMGKLTINGHFQ